MRKCPHGMSKTKEYRAWIAMKTRCENSNTPYWNLYGGRGIAVCERWSSSFKEFYSDMGPKPKGKFGVDRINVEGNYEPENCRWANSKTQCRNTRTNHRVQQNGSMITLAEAVEGTSLKYNTILYRLKRGWTVEQALSLGPQRGVKP